MELISCRASPRCTESPFDFITSQNISGYSFPLSIKQQNTYQITTFSNSWLKQGSNLSHLHASSSAAATNCLTGESYLLWRGWSFCRCFSPSPLKSLLAPESAPPPSPSPPPPLPSRCSRAGRCKGDRPPRPRQWPRRCHLVTAAGPAAPPAARRGNGAERGRTEPSGAERTRTERLWERESGRGGQGSKCWDPLVPTAELQTPLDAKGLKNV